MSCVPVVRAVALLALAFTAAPALAQQTAQQLILEGLRASGWSDSDIATLALIKSQSETVDKGLVIDLGSVRPRAHDPNSENAITIVALVLNPTDQPWCVRPKGATRGDTVRTSEVATRNFRVDPGTSVQFAQAVVIPNADGSFKYRSNYDLAAWAPSFLMSEDSQCDTAEPEYLADWLASEVYQPYVDFEAEYGSAVDEMGEYFRNED